MTMKPEASAPRRGTSPRWVGGWVDGWPESAVGNSPPSAARFLGHCTYLWGPCVWQAARPPACRTARRGMWAVGVGQLRTTGPRAVAACPAGRMGAHVPSGLRRGRVPRRRQRRQHPMAGQAVRVHVLAAGQLPRAGARGCRSHARAEPACTACLRPPALNLDLAPPFRPAQASWRPQPGAAAARCGCDLHGPCWRLAPAASADVPPITPMTRSSSSTGPRCSA